MKRIWLLFLTLPIAALGWYGYGSYWGAKIPRVEIRASSALAVDGEKNLPFYELMGPLPSLKSNQIIPRLEYKKGPPNRFIERIALLVKTSGAMEKVIYYGRRTREDFPGLSWVGNEALYLETALRLSQGENVSLSPFVTFLLRPFLLREASRWLENVEAVHIMDQAGNPAFFFAGTLEADGSLKSTSLFIRRNSFYRVEYLAEKSFQVLNPEQLFRKSFLMDKRVDAMEYLAKNLSQVRLEKSSLELRSITWPILLLAANVSADPSSLEAYFHFAGISALLYRNLSNSGADTETLDVLRNNVLASEFYAKDINPTARKTAEISRLARLLTRNFE